MGGFVFWDFCEIPVSGLPDTSFTVESRILLLDELVFAVSATGTKVFVVSIELLC